MQTGITFHPSVFNCQKLSAVRMRLVFPLSWEVSPHDKATANPKSESVKDEQNQVPEEEERRAASVVSSSGTAPTAPPTPFILLVSRSPPSSWAPRNSNRAICYSLSVLSVSGSITLHNLMAQDISGPTLIDHNQRLRSTLFHDIRTILQFWQATYWNKTLVVLSPQTCF